MLIVLVAVSLFQMFQYQEGHPAMVNLSLHEK
jgi:hypothetical protein